MDLTLGMSLWDSLFPRRKQIIFMEFHIALMSNPNFLSSNKMIKLKHEIRETSRSQVKAINCLRR